MNKYGISGMINKANNELFNILIWNMKITCENIRANGAYQPDTQENAKRLMAAIDDYMEEANKKGF